MSTKKYPKAFHLKAGGGLGVPHLDACGYPVQNIDVSKVEKIRGPLDFLYSGNMRWNVDRCDPQRFPVLEMES